MINRGQRIVLLAEKLECFVETASRLYSMAEKEHKIRFLGKRTKLWWRMKCCWNEEKKEWYEVESIGVNRYRCLGCYEEVLEVEEWNIR